jgi:hypothetical protein
MTSANVGKLAHVPLSVKLTEVFKKPTIRWSSQFVVLPWKSSLAAVEPIMLRGGLTVFNGVLSVQEPDKYNLPAPVLMSGWVFVIGSAAGAFTSGVEINKL